MPTQAEWLFWQLDDHFFGWMTISQDDCLFSSPKMIDFDPDPPDIFGVCGLRQCLMVHESDHPEKRSSIF